MKMVICSVTLCKGFIILSYNFRIFVIFTMRRKKILLVSCIFSFLFNFSIFLLFKGEKPCHRRKNVKCTDSYDFIYLSAC